MATLHNDSLTAASAALNALLKTQKEEVHRFGGFMHAVHVMLGDRDRFKIAGIAEWASENERRKLVADTISAFLAADAEARKDDSKEVKALKQIARSRVKVNVTKAIDCLAAMFVIGTSHDAYATYDDKKGWRLPLVWFQPEGGEFLYSRKGQHGDDCCTFTERNGKVIMSFVPEGEDQVTKTFSVTPDSLIEMSEIRGKRLPKTQDASVAPVTDLKGAAELMVTAFAGSDKAPDVLGNASEDGSIAHNLVAWVVTHYRAEVIAALASEEAARKAA